MLRVYKLRDKPAKGLEGFDKLYERRVYEVDEIPAVFRPFIDVIGFSKVLPAYYVMLKVNKNLDTCKNGKMKGGFWGKDDFERFRLDPENNFWFDFHPLYILDLSDMTARIV